MEDRMLFVFVIALVINLVELIASSMSGTANVSSIGLIEKKSHNVICQDSERKALIEFYYEGLNNKDIDNIFHGYEGTKNCCLWGGVTCDVDGLVISLKLGNGSYLTNATQSHPSWPIPLGKLGSLETLQLEGFSFQSALPTAIGLLPQSLVELSLTSCDFLHPVPWTALANLSSLSYLHISGTDPNSLDFGFLITHRDIPSHFPGSRISASLIQLIQLPPEVCNLTNLNHLDLRYNSFTGHLPSCVFSSLLPHLSYLDLSSNSFFGRIPPLWNSSSSLTLLDLSSNNLDGPIAPAFLGHNIHLQFLHLEGNSNLSGSIPESVGNFTNLLELTMAHNQVSGTISQIQWEKLLNLTHLDLSHNQLWGTIPASLIGQLEYLDLSHNQLWGTIPASSGHELRIEYLDLSHNNITGSIPCWIGSSPITSQLQYLDLSFNKFTSFFNISSFNTSLYHLDLSHNLLHGFILPWLNATRFTSLNTLDLSDNLLHGTIPSWFMPPIVLVNFSSNLLSGALSLAGLCTASSSFDASNNNFSSLLPTDLGACTLWRLDLHSNNFKGVMPWNPLFGNDTAGIDISTLNLANNRLSGEFPEWLGKRTYKAPSIQWLDMSHNHLSGAIPSYLNSWGLSYLDLSSNIFSGEIPSSICIGSSQFMRLYLAYNNIRGSIPHELSHCTSLQSLVLHNNLLTGFIPAEISNLSSTLQLLDLAHNQLEGSLPLGLQHMYSLRVLCLEYNNLSGLLPFSQWNTTQLQVLDLSYNHLTGNISAESLSLLQGFRYNQTRNTAVDGTLYEESIIHAKGQDLDFSYILEATVSLDLSYNELHGRIPPQLGSSLNGLVFLDLSHNHLSGSIPQEFNNLKQLQSLDLSNNELQGEIPDLCPLTFLEFANISDNQLKGMIPQCPQWSTFNSSSFLGNKELCGSQINVSCINYTSGPINYIQPDIDHADQPDIDDDNDFLLAVIVGVCISFPLCLVITMFWRPVSQPIRIMSKQMVAKVKSM